MLGRMVELQKLWDDALVDAAKTKAAKENTAGDGSVQEQARQAYENKNLAEDSEVYNYGFLTSLPDMRITRLPEVPMIRDTGGKVNSAVVITEGMKNARSVGGERDGKIYVQNAYTGRQLRIDTSSIRHGLNGGVNRLITNARLGAVIGDVVQNAVPVNALYNKAKDVMGTYAMAAYANDSRNREFVAIVTVEQRSGNISGLESYDVTHAVSGRQKNSSQADTKSQGVYPIKAAKISIADFLSIVNSTHQSVLSDDVLQHFRESRNPNGDYSGRVKFSERDSAGNELSQQQREFFTNSKVVDGNGNLKVMYRGGNGDFTVFDRKHSKGSNLYGRGFYFTDSVSLAIQYGSARAYYLNITSPVSTTETTIARGQMRKFLEAVAANEDDFSFENYGYGSTPSSVLRSVYTSGRSDFAMLYDVDQTAVGDMVASVELFNKVNGTDYDGLILDTETVAFYPEQIKNVDNREPTGDPDIRFSERDDTRTDRDVLSDAVDGDAANVRETVTGAGCSAIWTEYKSSGCIAWMQPLLFCAGFSTR